MHCETLKYTNHAVEFMAKRGIKEHEVESIIKNGEMIEQYPDDKPFPSQLIFATISGRPVHLVLGFDEKTSACYVVTAYEPHPDKFENDFKTRKPKS
jgi:hypothetical protein